MGALGFEGKEMVEGGDSVDAAGGQLEFVGDEQQEVVLEESKQFLRLVEDLDEGIVFELMLLHVRFQDLEALVPAGVGEDIRQPVRPGSGNSCCHFMVAGNRPANCGRRAGQAPEAPAKKIAAATPSRSAEIGIFWTSIVLDED
jgi:hypothetical protein